MDVTAEQGRHQASTVTHSGRGAQEVDRHLSALDQPKRSTLEALRTTILELLPKAEEGMSSARPCSR